MAMATKATGPSRVSKVSRLRAGVRGTHPGRRHAPSGCGGSITIDNTMMVFADGEDLGVTDHVDVGVVAAGVTFVC